MKLELLLGICKGAPADASPFRPGELTFQDVVYCTIEAPDPESAYKHRGDISFRFARTEPGEVPAHLLEATCQQFLCYSIFVLDWWAHIHIAARDVSLTWADCRDRI